MENEFLMSEINLHKFIGAIDALNLHKAAGAGGLRNDFDKDAQPELAPALVEISYELLHGGYPPPSFLKGLVMPLRKQGDSEDVMDYRPITLIQTSYKSSPT